MSYEFVFGIHAAQSVIERYPERIVEAFLLQGRLDQRIEPLLVELKNFGMSVQMVSRRALDEKSEGGRHQGILLKVKEAPRLNEQDLARLLDGCQTPFLLVLDGVTDPHNIGACLRSADGAGAHAVIVPKDRAGGLSATAHKVASGAAESVPFIQVTNMARTLRELQLRGIRIIGTAGETEHELHQADLRGPLALVMGSEEKGMRRLTRECCDLLIRIPMVGTVSSLNVSVATGVCLYEALRQRNVGED